MSVVAGMTKAYVNLKPDKSLPWESAKMKSDKSLPWENGKDSTTCLVTLDRMKSDDQIVRRQEASGE
ncbi:hypothetical protein ANCCAN_15195 [Ancylostoma caninum]|uniref:Uncharacterized protein n=1 Tax=Ancylostoma caninum TaxID=29170 RepID=A0A368G7E2_ANCCA|nr:hypothetical protein ANCCAN_15195 [Ancylostoma caninum]